MDMLGKVRRMRMRDSISISAIAKRTGLARNTIKKWLKAPGSVVPKYLRAKDLRKISSFEPVLLQALKADQLRHKDSRRTARALFVQITAQGYRGGYSGVTDFVRAWREQGGKAPKAFVPLFFENGEAFQFDWSEEGLLVGGLFYKVSSTCLVRVARNRYSVPCEWANKIVSTRLYPNQIVVVAGDAIVARHDRLSNQGKTAYDWQHYIELVQRKPGALRNGAPFLDMPPVLQQLRQSLMRYLGGDRAMADILAVVPRAGLEAVLVAVAIALEDVTPSGQVSIEHVENVLARLNSPPAPPPAETDLQLKEAPRADTARYDQLREIQQETEPNNAL